MKKLLFLTSMILITNVANAETEYYAAMKMGIGDATIYVNSDDKLGDYLVRISEAESGLNGYNYDASGLLWEVSPAIGVDWAMNLYGWFHLRLEGEFGYNRYHEKGKLKYNYAVTDRTKVELNQFFMLVNGYADFRIDKVVPYIGLGLGYGFGKDELTISNEYGDFSDSINDNGIIYALHLGVGYKFSEITTFDLGLRRVYAPAEDKGSYIFDTVRLGARFRI